MASIDPLENYSVSGSHERRKKERRIKRYQRGFTPYTASSGTAGARSSNPVVPRMEGSSADIHLRILKKRASAELDRHNLRRRCTERTLSRDSDQRQETSTPRYKKPFRDLPAEVVTRTRRVMRDYRNRRQSREIRESLHVFSALITH